MLGPIFYREASVAPKRPKTFVARGVYVLSLFTLLCTGYLVLDGSRSLATSGDSARFGGWMFTLLAPLQLLVLSSLAAVGAAASVAQEKDRRTLILLLLTRLSGFEIVAGKLSATLLAPFTLLLSALPLFLVLPILGGVSPTQVGGVFLVTAVTILFAGSVGTVIGLWREKTFQAIAMTVLSLLTYLGIGEILASQMQGIPETVRLAIAPARALAAAASPMSSLSPETFSAIAGFVVTTFGLSIAVLVTGILRVRVWNPSRELRIKVTEDEEKLETKEAQVSWRAREPKPVWDNPILWREVCTWAYGRKVMIIRVAFALLFCVIAAIIQFQIEDGVAYEAGGRIGRALPAATLPLAGLGVISLVLVNALAVNSVTNERDGLALDLLLVTDLSPSEFVFGKLMGVIYVGKEMIVTPLLLLIYLAIQDVMSYVLREHGLCDLGSGHSLHVCNYARNSLWIELCVGADSDSQQHWDSLFLMCWNCHLHDDHGQLSWSIPTTIGSIFGHDSGWWSSIIRITGLEEPKLGNLFCVLWSTSRDFLCHHTIPASNRPSLCFCSSLKRLRIHHRSDDDSRFK